MVRVVLDCGFRLVAPVTRRSAEHLGLAPGKTISALVKAPSVRPGAEGAMSDAGPGGNQRCSTRTPPVTIPTVLLKTAGN